jgi:hypothetical protein
MMPITRFNFQPIGNGKPGPIYQNLLEAWSTEVGIDISNQANRYAKLSEVWVP